MVKQINGFRILNDLTGQVFGRLTVIGPVGKKWEITLWECLCSCGKVVPIPACSLTKGATKSCGCIKLTAQDFSNKVINTFHILYKAPRRPGNGNAYWKAKCKECGLEKEITHTALLGGTITCKCQKSNKLENTIKPPKKSTAVDISGQTFGRLTALYFWSLGPFLRHQWLFLCECGNTKITDKASVVSGKTKSCGCLNLEVSRASIAAYHARGGHAGPNNPGWKGGTSSLNKLIRDKQLYADWRTSVFARDGYKCKGCGKKGKSLNAHHIVHLAEIIEMFNISSWEDAVDCPLLWSIENGITLCMDCHQKEHPELGLPLNSGKISKTMSLEGGSYVVSKISPSR